jgi:hypothetical protein
VGAFEHFGRKLRIRRTADADVASAGALAKALTDASAAGRFEVVILLVKELEARRVARITTA